jgi:hypothetical protein
MPMGRDAPAAAGRRPGGYSPVRSPDDTRRWMRGAGAAGVAATVSDSADSAAATSAAAASTGASEDPVPRASRLRAFFSSCFFYFASSRWRFSKL